jgi:adenylate kinase family enzyme
MAQIDLEKLARVIVVGTSCAGKTTFARQLAGILECRTVQLDELYWDANWTPKPTAEFVRLTDRATTGSHWVVDGNYRQVRDIVWPRATAIVWLNLGFARVFSRALRRTVARAISGESIYAGNRESLRRAFLSRESILLWVLNTYWDRRRHYRVLQASSEGGGLRWIELRRPADVTSLLDDVRRVRG